MDLQRRYDEQYDIIEEIEVQIGELQSQIRSIQQEKISGDNIYRLLLAFDEVYHSATEAEQKEFMKAFIERIEMFPEKRKDGSWIKKIVFNFPVPVDGEEVKELPLETETTVDAVKLVYQNEFGGGHMIKSPEAALIRLRNEYAATEHDAMQPLMIPIGSGMARVQLKALKESDIARLNEAFMETANRSKGMLPEFLEKLDVLRRVTAQGAFAFEAAELEEYLSEYKRQGYPAVSHSEEYRKAYLPAYRVVKESIFKERFK